MNNLDYLGFGIGLRNQYAQNLADHYPSIDWVEIMTEDHLSDDGGIWYYLEKIRSHYPLVMHGVSLSIGSTDPLNWDYLKKVKNLIHRIQPMWVSDHLCWTGVNQINLHDLMPLPYTEEAVKHVSQRVREVQDFYERQILLENVSNYVSYADSEMTEWEFIAAVAEESDCLILLDVNNIYVTAFNHHFSSYDFLEGIPVSRVQQFHLAGYSHLKTHIIDTHDDKISEEVWALYEAAVKRFGKVSTLIERDDHIPPIEELMEEVNQARKIAGVLTNSESETEKKLEHVE